MIENALAGFGLVDTKPEGGMSKVDLLSDGVEDTYQEYDNGEHYKKSDDEVFLLESRHDDPVKVLECKSCGGRDFHVGRGLYFTAIRCVKCNWEEAVHEG